MYRTFLGDFFFNPKSKGPRFQHLVAILGSIGSFLGFSSAKAKKAKESEKACQKENLNFRGYPLED